MASYEDYADAMRFKRRVVGMNTHSIGIEVRHHLRLMGVYSADPEMVAFHDGMARIGESELSRRARDGED